MELNDIKKMSRTSLEEFALQASLDRQAAKTSLRLVNDEIKKVDSLVRDASAVDPDVVEGWRHWIGKLQEEIDYWTELATKKSESLKIQISENQRLRETEAERHARLHNDLGRAYEAIEELAEVFIKVREQAGGLEDEKKVTFLRDVVAEIDKIAEKALASTAEFTGQGAPCQDESCDIDDQS